MMTIKSTLVIGIAFSVLLFTRCGEPTEGGIDMQNLGIGPIKKIELSPIDKAIASEGEQLFTTKCKACHKIETKYIGPALFGITTKRSPEWIMNMILNPQVMVQEDPIAKALFAQYLSPMANQSLTEAEARKILEYFRLNDQTTN